MSNELNQALSGLLKEEGSLVKELTDAAVKAAAFHTKLECIQKAQETGHYSQTQTDELVKKAKEKYADELEGKQKEQCYHSLHLH